MKRKMSHLSIVIVFLIFTIPSFCQTNLSDQGLKNQYDFYHKIANDPDIFWVVSTDIREIDRDLSIHHDLDLAKGKFVTREQFDKLIVNRIMIEGTGYSEDKIKLISAHIRASQIIKGNIREELLPNIRKLIQKRENSSNQNTNLSNNNYHQQNNTSFDDVLDRLTSDEHLDALSFDNILSSNQAGTDIQDSQVDSFDGDWNDSINNNYSSCPKTKPDNRSSFKAYPNGQNSGNTYRYCYYFKNGYLKREEPYKNGKLDGLKTSYSWSKKYNFSYISYRENYSNGKRNGLYEYYRLTKNGAVYRASLNTYSDGILHGDAAQWHENGQTKSNSNHINGRVVLRYNYREDGTFTYCTKWNDKGYPYDCKTGKRR